MKAEEIREAALRLKDRPPEAVDVSDAWPEIGTLYVSAMSGDDRDEWEWEHARAIDEKKPTTAMMLVRCITDAEGNRVFRNEDVSVLGSKNWKTLDTLWRVARRVNKISTEEQKAIEKNSEAPAGNGS